RLHSISSIYGSQSWSVSLCFASDLVPSFNCFFFFNDAAPTEIYTLSLHDALPIWHARRALADGLAQRIVVAAGRDARQFGPNPRSEEHTSELQSLRHLVCRLLLEKKKRDNPASPTQQKPTDTTRSVAGDLCYTRLA